MTLSGRRPPDGEGSTAMDRRDDTTDQRAVPTDPGLGPETPKENDTQRMATKDALVEAFGKARPAAVEHVESEGLDAARYYAGPREAPTAHTGERDRPLVEVVPTVPPVREEVPPIQTPDPGSSRRDVTTAVPRRPVWPWLAAGVAGALLLVWLVWRREHAPETTPTTATATTSAPATATTSAPVPVPTQTVSPVVTDTVSAKPVATATPSAKASTNVTPTASAPRPPPTTPASTSSVSTAPPPSSTSPLFTGHE